MPRRLTAVGIAGQDKPAPVTDWISQQFTRPSVSGVT